jgi:uncharacterized membrane protein
LEYRLVMDIRRILRECPGYVLRGALITGPLAVTLYIMYWVFRTVDQLLPVGIPGLGLVLTLLLVGLVGFFSSNMIGNSILEAVERFVRRVPLVKLVYSSIKDLINAFVGDKKSFDRPVLVQLSLDTGVKALGFVTRDTMLGLGLADHAAVYFPQSYNFAGNLLLVPRQLIQPLDASAGELMTFVVSGGVSGFGVGHPMLPAAAAAPPDAAPPEG